MFCLTGIELNLQKVQKKNEGKENLILIETKIYCNLPILQNVKSFLTNSSNKQQLINLFAQKLLIDGIQVKKATSHADMLIVKEALALAKVEK